METEFSTVADVSGTISAAIADRTRLFISQDCVLKTCCKKYKKGKRCKKCPN